MWLYGAMAAPCAGRQIENREGLTACLPRQTFLGILVATDCGSMRLCRGLGNLSGWCDQATPLAVLCWASEDHRCTGPRDLGGPRRRGFTDYPPRPGACGYFLALLVFYLCFTRCVPEIVLDRLMRAD